MRAGRDVPGEWPDLAGRLVEDRHVLPVRVYYEDTDFSGVVYHANFLKFLERGRSDFLRLLGIHHSDLAAPASGNPLVFAVRHMELDFLRPARIDDLLEIETRTSALRGARIVLNQRAVRGGEALVTATVTIAVIDTAGRPQRLPAEMRARLNIGEKTGANR